MDTLSEHWPDPLLAGARENCGQSIGLTVDTYHYSYNGPTQGAGTGDFFFILQISLPYTSFSTCLDLSETHGFETWKRENILQDGNTDTRMWPGSFPACITSPSEAAGTGVGSSTMGPEDTDLMRGIPITRLYQRLVLGHYNSYSDIYCMIRLLVKMVYYKLVHKAEGRHWPDPLLAGARENCGQSIGLTVDTYHYSYNGPTQGAGVGG
eukprot:sb/3470291/